MSIFEKVDTPAFTIFIDLLYSESDNIENFTFTLKSLSWKKHGFRMYSFYIQHLTDERLCDYSFILDNNCVLSFLKSMQEGLNPQNDLGIITLIIPLLVVSRHLSIKNGPSIHKKKWKRNNNELHKPDKDNTLTSWWQTWKSEYDPFSGN